MLRDYASFDVLSDNRARLVAFRDANFVLSIAVFIAAYFTIVVFSLPGAAVASVTGGFLFGLPLGTLLNVVAATFGASAIFLVARLGLGRALTARLDASDGHVKRLKQQLHDNEVPVLFLLRLVPAVPFFIANLLPALVGVRFGNFVVTTFFGIIPGAFVFTSIGTGVAEVFDRGETPDLSIIWSAPILVPLLGLSALAALPLVIKALQARNGGGAL